MKKQSLTKIISILIFLVFLVSIFSTTPVLQAATESKISNLYSNPNQSNGKNPYKFKISDVVSSNLLSSVVGCTGVVNKVSTWMSKFVQSPEKQAAILEDEAAKMLNQMKNACASVKAGAETGVGVTPGPNDLTSTVKTIFSKIQMKINGTDVKTCQEAVDSTSFEELKVLKKQAEKEMESSFKDQCLDGIAITLARNQLTSMTRSAMNWVNTGFNGDPFYVQNINSFMRNMTDNIVTGELDLYRGQSQYYPYGDSYYRSVIGGYQTAENFRDSMKQSLSFYLGSGNLGDDTAGVVERYADNFELGGWNGWLAFTQQARNNPLGYQMQMSQYIADKENQEIENTKQELQQNNGFLSQKTCAKYGVKIKNTFNIDGTIGMEEVEDKTKCVEWKTMTPGSIIKEKTTNYLNSPERQLELARTINDSLNALFSVLISKLENGGLANLSDSVSQTNWTDNVNSIDNYTSPDGNTTYSNNGAYNNFNLTRDLGNTYIHGDFTLLGGWDAKANKIITTNSKTNGGKLYPDLAPQTVNSSGDIVNASDNSYYIVRVEGNTKIIKEGHNAWAEGDRAFWDGEKWQNWKKAQTNPIKNRGVIQIQQDYIVAAKDIMKFLPSVMTNLGELDYCIPGPNPNYKINSTDAQSAYQDWIGSMYVGPRDEHRTEWRIDDETSRTYKTLANIFSDNQKTWEAVKKSTSMWLLDNFARKWTGIRTGEAYPDFPESQNYHFKPGQGTKEEKDIKDRENLMESSLDYVNNSLFQNFYETFDNMMNKIYFKNMTSKYKEYENKSVNIELDKNPAYVEMAESGLDLTKNIVYYGEDINTAINDYSKAVDQAKINIAKLDPIKSEVSGIIKLAQDRRDKNLIKILNEEAARTGGPVLTEAQYKAKYLGCLDEENIKFYDADTITGMGSIDEERCDNKIDDDLDGFIDIKDKDCPGYVDPNVSGLKTSGTGSGYRR